MFNSITILLNVVYGQLCSFISVAQLNAWLYFNLPTIVMMLKTEKPWAMHPYTSSFFFLVEILVPGILDEQYELNHS